MSTWYYGVLYEDDRKIIVMRVGKNFSSHSEILVEHIEYAKIISRAFEVIESSPVTTGDVIEILNEAVKYAESIYSTALLLYIFFCFKLGIEPRIISEYELYSEIGGIRARK